MMIILGIATGAVLGCGAWLKWAVLPVRIAYGAGRQIERLVADPARHVPAFGAGYRVGRCDRRRERL